MVEHRDETWAPVIDINLTGAYHAIRRWPSMRKRRFARIVNIPSTVAEVGFST
jgi:NAD(P)-dependent dehydrogenase (short-subunit alcohol dehydrogenase family)